LGCDVGYGLLHKIPAATGKARPKTAVKATPSSDNLGPNEFAATPLISPNASSILTSSPPSTPPVQVSNAVQPQPSPLLSAAAPLPTVVAPVNPSPVATVPAASSPVTPAFVSTPPLPHLVNSAVTPAVTPAVAAPTIVTPAAAPSTLPPTTLGTVAASSSSSSSISLPSTEQLQKQLEQLKLQQQRLQELRNKQLGITPPTTATSSPSNAPAAPLPSTGSDSSLAPAQFSAQTLTQLKLQAMAAKQQQQ